MRAAAFLTILLLTAVVIRAVTPPKKSRAVACSRREACFPWENSGPFCGRGAKMNLRFFTEFVYGADDTSHATGSNHTVTYAFCPRVDELQAFNITEMGAKSFTYMNGTDENNEPVYSFMTDNQRYLNVFGFGDTTNKEFPEEESGGRAMVADYTAQDSAGRSQCIFDQEIAYTPFLVVNVSMTKGHFQYFEGHSAPAGTGFVPTCQNDVCLFDQSMGCIGEGNNRNCAECVDIAKAREVSVQVWVSYYGTDASGRQLRSGANNPLNFQAFSGSGVSSKMRKSFNNIQNGETELDSSMGS
jgi:hypothetical protein